MLAAELAFRLSADLGVESVDDVWEEIERVSTAHAGITLEVLRSKAGDDGVLAPIPAHIAAAAEGTPVTIAGAAEETADQAGAETAAGDDASGDEAAVDDAGDEGDADGAAGDAVAEPVASPRPEMLTFTAPARHEAPARDSYSLRLLAVRSLYDAGTLVGSAPSLSGLAPGSRLLVNGAALERLGVADGTVVKVSSSRGSLTAAAYTDARLPAGAALLHVNQPGIDPGELIDATAAVTEVRLETV
jgi:anaerobic selenocysteine-containing dehydrogenase